MGAKDIYLLIFRKEEEDEGGQGGGGWGTDAAGACGCGVVGAQAPFVAGALHVTALSAPRFA